MSRDHTVITVDGDLDLTSVPDLRSIVLEQLEGGAKLLVLDMSGCGFIDSAGLGAILGALRRARAVGGGVELVIGSERIRSLFRSCDLDRVFDLHASLAEARDRLASSENAPR